MATRLVLKSLDPSRQPPDAVGVVLSIDAGPRRRMVSGPRLGGVVILPNHALVLW